MVDVPAATPVNTPLVEPIVPTAILLLLQLPPVIPSINVIVLPEHTVVGPVIGPGAGFTVTVVVTKQPVGNW